MKKILCATAIALSLTLGGCITVGDAISVVTTDVKNPVTPTMLYNAENAMIVAVSGLVAYKRACIAKLIDRSCRAVVVQLQGYTRKAKPILVELRVFVRNNDQVNAIKAYNVVTRLIANFKQTAARAGAV